MSRLGLRILSLGLLACRPSPVVPASAHIPDLPAYVNTPVGRVAVERVKGLTADSTRVWGVWYWERRLIQIERDMPNDAAWLVLYHEECHVAFTASGLAYLVTEPEQEAICDAMAVARMQERQSS